jgi:rhomboid protease GluP
MANIHGFGDRDNNRNIFRNYRLSPSNGENNNNEMFLLGGNDNVKPREESFYHFITNLICPRLTLNSFIFVITIINLIAFILTLIPGLQEIKDEMYFLSPTNKVINDYSLNPNKMKKEKLKNLYRWITNALIHANFLHIFGNTISLLIFGSLTESFIKTKKIAIVYITSGLLGGLFSMICERKAQSVGASICVYGVFGAYFAFFIIKWVETDNMFGPMGKCCMFYFVFFYIIFNLFIELNNLGMNEINVYGHLGGLIFGFLVSVLLIKPDNEESSACCSYKIWWNTSVIFISVFSVIGLVYFYVFMNLEEN